LYFIIFGSLIGRAWVGGRTALLQFIDDGIIMM